MVNTKPSVLIVDDEQTICELLYDELSGQGCPCRIVLNGHDALITLGSKDFNVVLLDIKLPDISGMEILNALNSARRNTIVIIITGINSVDTAVESIKCGAADYIVKPFSLDRVNTSIQTALADEIRLPEDGNRKTPLSLDSGAENKSAEEESYRQIDAIASGVEARYDLIFGHSKIVNQEAVDIARQLGIPNKVIQRWANARSRLDSERWRAIGYSLDKLERSPLAQELMGLLRPHPCTPKNDKSQN